ncbi:uncharacterized protein K02A2.6-like [Teleopsis dalmanni]|uniref:uncharacterized protein K02A2.6-like n=1 Tax=Teleopsis dalmanni TaxID=139649 RepID=UPI0018CD1AAE|nr:uncharacterized protein K02A2.6-like [Teleopsis dalmanni]
MQLQDSKLQQVVMKIEDKDSDIINDYKIINERLYKRYKNQQLFVIPKALRWKVTHDAHVKTGHLSVDGTIEYLLRSMWFARMRNFVKSFVKACIDCAFTKRRGGKKEGELHCDKMEPIPFKTIHIDHLGPFPRSRKLNEYILIIVDSFTKFVIVRPVKSTNTKQVIAILNEVTSYVGIPETIISDRGTAFTSKEFERYCNDQQIKHIRNAVRTPRANGQVERFNRTVLSMLQPSTQDDRTWDEQLRSIQCTLNSLISQTTGKSPNELLFGFKLRDILGNKLIQILQDEDDTIPITQEELHRRRLLAANNTDSKRVNAKKRFDDKHRKPTKYEQGDLVLAEREPTSTGTSRKLECRYKGPFVVTEVLDNDRYVIEDLPGSYRKQRHYKSIYASDLLKPWCQLPYEEETDSEREDA